MKLDIQIRKCPKCKGSGHNCSTCRETGLIADASIPQDLFFEFGGGAPVFTPFPKPKTEEPSLEEILATIRTIIGKPPLEKRAPFPAPQYFEYDGGLAENAFTITWPDEIPAFDGFVIYDANAPVDEDDEETLNDALIGAGVFDPRKPKGHGLGSDRHIIEKAVDSYFDTATSIPADAMVSVLRGPVATPRTPESIAKDLEAVFAKDGIALDELERRCWSAVECIRDLLGDVKSAERRVAENEAALQEATNYAARADQRIADLQKGMVGGAMVEGEIVLSLVRSGTSPVGLVARATNVEVIRNLVLLLDAADREDWDFLLGRGEYARVSQAYQGRGDGGRERWWKERLGKVRDILESLK